MTKTTILIPNYNGIKYIEACLDSIMSMSESYPVIIVDNGSSDGSDKLIEEKYIHKTESESDSGVCLDGSDIKIIHLSENTGFCHAVNVGLAEVTTPYVFLLNNDTEVCPDTIEKLERRMESDDSIFSVQSLMFKISNHDLIDDAGDFYSALGWARGRYAGKSVKDVQLISTNDEQLDGKKTDIFSACGAAVLYRMSIINEIGNFDENHFAYLEDIDLGYRARIHGYRNVLEPASVIYHAGSATSGSKHNKFKVNLSSKNNIYLIYKNMPLLQIIINLPLLIPGFLIKALFFALKGMGLTYVRGLGRGFALCASDIKNGHRHKVKFKPGNLGHYFKIQISLWRNMIP